MSHTFQASSTCAAQQTGFKSTLRAHRVCVPVRTAVFQQQTKRAALCAAGPNDEANSGIAKRAAVPRVDKPTEAKPTTVQEAQNNPLEAVAETAKHFVQSPVDQVKSFVEYGLATAENVPETIRRLGEGVAEGEETQPASRPDATSPAFKGTPTSKEGPRE